MLGPLWKTSGGFLIHVFVVQSLSHVQLFVTPRTAACQASLSFPISWNLLKFMSIESVMLSNHLILFHPHCLLLQSFPETGSFPMSWLFPSSSQGIGASASASVLQMFICSGIQYTTGEEWRHIFRRNEEVGPKHKRGSLVDVSGCERKV